MSSPWFDNYTTMTVGSSEANKLGNGRYVKSDRINAGGHSWRIAFYPNGRLVGTTASMSLFLLLDDDNSEGGRTTAAAADEYVVHVKFRFMMHEVYHDRSPVFLSSTVAAAFSRRSNAHGFERFVSREDFEKTALFKSDRFAIECRLTVFPAGSKRTTVQMSRSSRPDPTVVQARVPPAASPEPSVVTAAPPPKPSVSAAGQRDTAPLSGLPADLGCLLATKEGADVDLEVRGKVFAAHKSVLAARSPVFMEQLFGPAKEEDTSYVSIILNMRPEAFEVLSHYLYIVADPQVSAAWTRKLKQELIYSSGSLQERQEQAQEKTLEEEVVERTLEEEAV
ncbi:BTB/POZ and MATH domain-containing protein 1-like [Miscanthus floridulus]|uniref:BTB/POZ and MATH domain-containing protein 1-like n=1 Tax=Miscanthus floridulus TaxID=154761 RepID=UPI00345AD400